MGWLAVVDAPLLVAKLLESLLIEHIVLDSERFLNTTGRETVAVAYFEHNVVGAFLGKHFGDRLEC